MRLPVLVIASACVALAAVDGVVTNQTTGKPQGGATVTLIELGSGMKNIGSVKSSADGKFTFPADMQAGTPYLLQAHARGCELQPHAAPRYVRNGHRCRGLSIRRRR